MTGTPIANYTQILVRHSADQRHRFLSRDKTWKCGRNVSLKNDIVSFDLCLRFVRFLCFVPGKVFSRSSTVTQSTPSAVNVTDLDESVRGSVFGRQKNVGTKKREMM